MTESRLTIDGMSCGHCVAAVEKALGDVEGVRVQDVEVGSARIGYDPGEVDEARVRRAVEEQGFGLRALEDLR